MMLQGRERTETLAAAIVKIARQKRGALLNAADLFDLVKQHCPPGSYPTAESIVGLLQVEGFEKFKQEWHGPDPNKREVGELRRLIEAEGVLFWDREEDRCWRIVDTTLKPRLSWSGGCRCRFCDIQENPLLNELELIDLRAHNSVVTGLVHSRCRPHLEAWHAKIAAKPPARLEAASK